MEVKDLRRMIDQVRDEYESRDRNASDAAQKSGSDARLAVRQRTDDGLRFTPERAQQEWFTRSRSMAFSRMLESRRALPIHQHKNQILETIGHNPVSIIRSATGSGKSTQTASFILEHHLSSGRDCRILVTQPRRISAITIARRVSTELGEPPGTLGTFRSLVGYSIRLESKTSPTTRLTFATTGVLLRMLESSPMLDQLDYLILDEVHERTLETDLLFIALRELLKKRHDLKVVLMSATVDAKLFSDYFGGAPILDIPGRTFPVEILYLEDAIETTRDVIEGDGAFSASPDEAETDDDHQPARDRRGSSAELDSYSSETRRALADMDEYRIDYGLVVRLAVAIATKKKYARYSSAILIFMPGISEIRRLYRALMSTDSFNKGWNLHMLHSSFSTEELERAFAIHPPGERKIVIATNIAETGITIPDVTAVIDTCKEKIMRYNERRQLSKLTEGFISRSSAGQRRGRAARVQEGLCFHLVTKERYENVLQEQTTPEILRLSLQDPILRVKIWNLGSIEETLAAAISPPPKKNVVRAIDKLRSGGALTGSEHLTALGEQVARLPLDIALAKLAIYGAIFRCLVCCLPLRDRVR
jgi:ATP-dependent RNA helicase DHX29